MIHCYRQLRFSLYSGAVTTKVLTIVVFLYYPLVLTLWSILCLMPSCLFFCSVVGCCSAYPLLVLLFSLKELCLPCSSDCSALLQLSLSEDLGFCSLFYLVHICTALWDSLSGLVHSGIALSGFPGP